MKVSVSMPWELLNEFDQLAAHAGYSRSEAVREAMRSFMDELRKRERYKGLVKEEVTRV